MFRLSVPTAAVDLEAEGMSVAVPAGIADLAGFRAWAHSVAFPKSGRIDFLGGTIWLDLRMDEMYSHNLIKTAIYAVVIPLVHPNGPGAFLNDRIRFSHPGADSSVEPDAVYVTYDALNSGRVVEVRGTRGVMELEGSPEMVLEVVSASSFKKDYQTLPVYYAAAGVNEFWRVDARTDLSFEILRLEGGAYAPARLTDGWWRSDVYGRDFRLIDGTDPRGNRRVVLEMR